ncbi:MAG: hypothetical protein U0168_32220 [Nannocystaceae bacterium]
MTTKHTTTWLRSSLSARLLGAAMAMSLATTLPACGRGTDRWVTTEDSRVDIDWDEVSQAYKDAEGPEDFERRVNEIYTGDEVISVSVQDKDEKTQIVTGFFDKNEDGKAADDEAIFTIQRDLVSADKGQYQIAGYGPYAGYHSPMWDIAAGMMMGSMMMSLFSPGYRPMYTTPYTTAPGRRGELMTQRNAWRQSNPDTFNKRASKSGRSYGAKGGGFGGGRPAPGPRMPSRGGGRFGMRRAPAHAPVRLA